jgi:hypothetical protein
MPPFRKRPDASVIVFDDGQGEPIVIDHGFGAYLDTSIDLPGGTVVSADANGKPLLAWSGSEHGEAATLCRPYVVPQDTRLTDWTVTPAASWDERRPTDGYYRVYRLAMFDSTPGLAWTATSNYSLPADANFAISVIQKESPSDWDFTGMVPFFRIEVGDGSWGLYFEKSGGNFFLRRNTKTGQFEAIVHTLKGLQKFLNSDEAFIFIECQENRIRISTNFGEGYDEFGDDDNPFHIPSGKVRIVGRGGKFHFGIHQIKYFQGDILFPSWNTFFGRVGASLIITGRYNNPNGTGVTFTDQSNLANNLATVKATLTPSFVPGYPWGIYYSPSLRSITLRYPIVRQVVGNASSTPLDPYLIGVDITLPRKRDTASCTLRLNTDINNTSILSQNWRWRKVQVKLGYLMSDGTHEWYTTFTGYVQSINPSWDDSEFGRKTVVIEVANATVHFARPEWTRLDTIPLGGVVPNFASDFILTTEGLMDEARTDFSRSNWWFTGSLSGNILPVGSAKKPFELIRPGEKKWETIKRLQSHHGCEAYADSLGVYSSQPFNYVEPTVTWHYYPDSQVSTDVREQILKISNLLDFTETCTAVMSIGHLPWGQEIMAWNIDSAAELNVASGRFCRWREVLQDEVKDTITPALLWNRATFLAQNNFGLKYQPDVVAPVHPGLRQKQRVAIHGCAGINIPNAAEHCIEALKHSYRSYGESLTSLTTSAGLRRL